MIASKVNTSIPNSALVSLIHDFSQIITLDACVLIPLDRSKENSQIPVFDFPIYRKFWLDVLFKTFPYLAIHDAVLEECFSPAELHRYLKKEIDSQRLMLLSDSNLTPDEESYRRSMEYKIAEYTSYNPDQDNNDDRGEVKSLAHIKTKDYLYFCSRDSNAIRLIQDSDKYEASLETIQAIHIYELAYYFVRMDMCKSKQMRSIYKYIYHLTKKEIKSNPEWTTFLDEMDNLYLHEIEASLNKPKSLV